MRIRNKLILILIFISVVPVLTLAFGEIYKDRKALEKQIGDSSLELARVSMKRINDYIYDEFEDIQSWIYNLNSKNIVISEDSNNILHDLIRFGEDVEEYYYINYVNNEGKVITSSNNDLIGSDLSAIAGFRKALNGNPFIQDVSFDELAGDYSVVMFIPITESTIQSEPVGVLVAALKWDKVNEMITSIKVGGREQTISNHIMLLNKDGMVISCFDKKEMFTDNLVEAGIKSAKYAQEHKEGYLTETSEHGLFSFVTYTYSREYKALPYLNWIMILEQDPEEVFAVIGLSKKTIITTLSGTSVLLIIISFLFANRISKPILTIVSAARAIGKGGMNIKVPVKSNDEIGLLSASFNEMVENLKESSSELRESEEQNRHVLRTALDGFWVTDIEGRMLEVNDAYCNLTGYSREELLKMSVFDVEAMERPEDTEKHIQQVIKEGGDRFESKHRCKDGRIIDVDISSNYVKTRGGRFFVFIRDITERKNAENELWELNQSLEQRVAERTAELVRVNEELVKMQKLESVGILAGGIAHDFNNYLQGILSNIAIAKSYTDSNDKIYLNLTESEKAVIQAKNLTQQLLTFSKGGDPIKKVASAPELIKESAKFALSGSNIRCELALPDCDCFVKVDKGQMNQVFNNLFINADHAMSEGGTIRVSAVHYNAERNDLLPLQEGRYVKITIKDQGAGISQEHLQKIFDPYFTTKETGSGLGLATAFSIVKKHDGYITAESEIGVGTTFYIYLPALQEEISKERIEGGADKESVERMTSLDGRRILFMEDEAIISLAVARQLRNLNYEVETARDGLEAIELYKSASESGKPFNAVIMDLTIPGGMGGEETIKKLLELDPDVAAIVASGYSDDPIMTDFNKYGFRGMVEKPYEIYELSKVLQEVMRKKES